MWITPYLRAKVSAVKLGRDGVEIITYRPKHLNTLRIKEHLESLLVRKNRLVEQDLQESK